MREDEPLHHLFIIIHNLATGDQGGNPREARGRPGVARRRENRGRGREPGTGDQGGNPREARGRPGCTGGGCPGGAVQKGAVSCSMGFLVSFLFAFAVTFPFSVLVTCSVASRVAFLAAKIIHIMNNCGNN